MNIIHVAVTVSALALAVLGTQVTAAPLDAAISRIAGDPRGTELSSLFTEFTSLTPIERTYACQYLSRNAIAAGTIDPAAWLHLKLC